MYPLLQKLFAAGGTQGPVLQKALANVLLRLTIEIVERSDQAKGFAVLKRRWVVERKITWFNRCRIMAKDFANLSRNALAFLRLASIRSCSEDFVIPHEVTGETLGAMPGRG